MPINLYKQTQFFATFYVIMGFVLLSRVAEVQAAAGSPKCTDDEICKQAGYDNCASTESSIPKELRKRYDDLQKLGYIFEDDTTDNEIEEIAKKLEEKTPDSLIYAIKKKDFLPETCTAKNLPIWKELWKKQQGIYVLPYVDEVSCETVMAVKNVALCRINPEFTNQELVIAAKDAQSNIKAELKKLRKMINSQVSRFSAATTRYSKHIEKLEEIAAVFGGLSKESEQLAQKQNTYNNSCTVAKVIEEKFRSYDSNISTWNDQLTDICAKSCVGRSRYCIEASTGKALCRKQDELPYEVVGPGDTVIFHFVDLSDNAGGKCDLKTPISIYSHDSIFATSASAGSSSKSVASSSNEPLKNLYADVDFRTVCDDVQLAIPNDRGLLSLSLTYQWTPPVPDEINPLPKKKPEPLVFSFDVDQGKYYLEVGFMVAGVINGSRTITAAAVPGSNDRKITSVSDFAVSPALALNLFPGGRRNGRISAFAPGRGRGSFWDFVGLQAAVDLDLKNAFSRIYLGLALEPIAGLSVSGGLAIVKADSMPSGYAENMLLPISATFTPNSSYMTTGYLGMTVTNEILTTITGAAKAIRDSAAAK